MALATASLDGAKFTIKPHPNVQKTDIPFAQDAVGDRFLLRQDSVNRLNAETGDVNSLGMTWQVFLNAATVDPVQFLSLRPLIRFTSEGGRLDPGQLLSVYPPFCTAESSSGVSLKPIPALERIRFLADFAKQIRGLPERTKIRLRVD